MPVAAVIRKPAAGPPRERGREGEVSNTAQDDIKVRVQLPLCFVGMWSTWAVVRELGGAKREIRKKYSPKHGQPLDP